MIADLFPQFDDLIVGEFAPWLREQGFEGHGRSFQMTLPREHLLLLGVKTSKWNRRQRNHFDFLVEAFVKDPADRLIWYWKSSTDGIERAYSVWHSLDEDSDMALVLRELKQSIQRFLIPAAENEVTRPSSPSLAGTRIDHGQAGV